MKFAEKEFSEYWTMIKIPTYVLIGWSVAGLIISIISFSLYTSIFSPLVGWVLTLAVFGFIGWTAVKDHNQSIKIAAWAGALSGVLYGFVGAVIGIIMVNLVPAIVDLAMSSAAASGIPAETMESMIKIGVYIGLVTGPLISGLVAAAISAISGLIARKV